MKGRSGATTMCGRGKSASVHSELGIRVSASVDNDGSEPSKTSGSLLRRLVFLDRELWKQRAAVGARGEPVR